VLKFITLLKKELPLTFNLYVPGSVVPIATLPVLLLYILVPDVVQTEAVDDIGFPPTLNVPDILTSPNTSTLYVADGALPIPTLPVSVLVPVIDTLLAKVAKPVSPAIVNRVAVLVDNVKAPTPFEDIESGIDTSFPATIIEPADILVNAAIGPQDIFVVAVIAPVDVIEPVFKPPPIVTSPASVIDNLVVGVAPVRILKALVPFV
jgi:hypothetical protein